MLRRLPHFSSGLCFLSSASVGAPAPPLPPPLRPPLRLLGAGTSLAHPEKERGEDAFFSLPRALGVADGVGGWAEHGVDAGEYARQLMSHVERSACAARPGGGPPPPPLELLEAAHAAVRVEGSSTACVATLGGALSPSGAGGCPLLVHNVGDSGLQVWGVAAAGGAGGAPAPLRLEEAARLWRCAHVARMTQHGFNFPRQLAADERYSDAPGPHGAGAAFPLAGGELLLAATDGLWDNLDEGALRAVLSRFDFSTCRAYARMQRARFAAAAAAARDAAGSPIGEGGSGVPLETRFPVAGEDVSDAALLGKEREALAQLRAMSAALAFAAQRVGADPRASTPFAEGAARAGQRFKGGKLDDATVVVALVTADPAFFTAHV
jgi:hypothetical protein